VYENIIFSLILVWPGLRFISLSQFQDQLTDLIDEVAERDVVKSDNGRKKYKT